MAMNTAFVPEDYFARYSVSDIFGTGETCEVDLGCGDGGFLLAMAEHYPETRFLGVERLLGRIRKVCNESARRGLSNVRGLRVESRYFLEWMVAPGSNSRLHYLFPDPWPKEKHHKNRLVQDSFIPVLHRALAPGGEVLFKTDHEEYFQWVCFPPVPQGGVECTLLPQDRFPETMGGNGQAHFLRTLCEKR